MIRQPELEDMNPDLIGNETEPDIEEPTAISWIQPLCPKCNSYKWFFLRCRAVQGVFEFEVYCDVCGTIMQYSFNPTQPNPELKQSRSYLG